jgi:hypothetical protein
MNLDSRKGCHLAPPVGGSRPNNVIDNYFQLSQWQPQDLLNSCDPSSGARGNLTGLRALGHYQARRGGSRSSLLST